MRLVRVRRRFWVESWGSCPSVRLIRLLGWLGVMNPCNKYNHFLKNSFSSQIDHISIKDVKLLFQSLYKSKENSLFCLSLSFAFEHFIFILFPYFLNMFLFLFAFLATLDYFGLFEWWILALFIQFFNPFAHIFNRDIIDKDLMNFIGEFIFYIKCQFYLVKNKFIFVPEPYIYFK